MASYVGSINAATSTGNVSYTSIGFQPKLLILFGVNLAATGDNDSTGFESSYGMTDGTDSYCWGISYGAGGTPRRAYHDTSVYRLVSTASAITAEAEIVSFDADGFTLNWTTAAASGWSIGFLAVGGSGVNSVKLLTTDLTATGSKAVTGAGFQPNAGLFMSYDDITVPSVSDGERSMSFAAHDGTNYALFGLIPGAALSNGMSRVISDSDVVFGWDNNVGGSEEIRADVTSYDSDGITLNVGVHTDDTHVAMLLMNVNANVFACGEVNPSAATGTEAFTGVGFQPEVVFGFGGEAISYTNRSLLSADNPISIGGSDGTRQRGIRFGSKSTLDGASVGYVTADIYRSYTNGELPSSTTVLQFDIDSLDADGFTINKSVGSASDPMGFIAFAGGDSFGTFDNKIIYADGVTVT
jgi:hypothetical protein